jgi:outer membrane protein assembly factor BamB
MPAIKKWFANWSLNAEKERIRRATQRREDPFFSALLCGSSLSLRFCFSESGQNIDRSQFLEPPRRKMSVSFAKRIGIFAFSERSLHNPNIADRDHCLTHIWREMMRWKVSLILSVFAFVLASLPVVSADNWPQWRGPSLNGISTEKNLPVKLGPAENVAWKMDLPAWSGSTPIVWNNHIFITMSDPGSAERSVAGGISLWCLDRVKGAVMWKKPLGTGDVKMRKQNMSSPSPVTDGRYVWSLTGTGVLKAFDFKGAEIWSRDIQKEYGEFGLNWGYASSPLLYEDSLYIPVLHGMKTDAPSYLLRINKTTGKTTWKVDRPTPAQRESPDSYITPALLRYNGTLEIVVSGGDCVTGHDPATGKELWRSYGLNPGNDPFYRIVNSPIVMDGLIYAGAKSKPYLAVRAGGRGDVTTSHRAWIIDSGPDVPTPVTDGKYLYIVRDNGGFLCLDAKTGKDIYPPQRLKSGTYSSSPVLADGKIYATNEDGLISVIKAGPQFELLAENALEDYTLSSPAISDGQIFIRTAHHLYCFGKRVGK